MTKAKTKTAAEHAPKADPAPAKGEGGAKAPTAKAAAAEPKAAKAKPSAPAGDAPAAAGKGLGKPMRPSEALAAVIGPDPVPRTEVVRKVWDHIRANGLQDASNKQLIVADDKLRAVFGKDSATMFEMQRLLTPHLSAAA